MAEPPSIADTCWIYLGGKIASEVPNNPGVKSNLVQSSIKRNSFQLITLSRINKQLIYDRIRRAQASSFIIYFNTSLLTVAVCLDELVLVEWRRWCYGWQVNASYLPQNVPRVNVSSVSKHESQLAWTNACNWRTGDEVWHSVGWR